MTGPEHYREAERLMVRSSGSPGPGGMALILQAAQVHATLALAAAVGLSRNGEMPGLDSDAWIGAVSSTGGGNG